MALGAEPELTKGYEGDALVLTFFAAEYLARLWVVVENPHCCPGLKGRLRYILSMPSLIDLAVLLSTPLASVGSEPSLLRLVWLVR